MTKTEAREIAKHTLVEAIGCAYYKICEGNDYTVEEKEAIINYINQYGKSACKAFGKTYVGY